MLISALAVTTAPADGIVRDVGGLPVAPREVIVAVNAMFVTLGAGISRSAPVSPPVCAPFSVRTTPAVPSPNSGRSCSPCWRRRSPAFPSASTGPHHADDPGSSVTHAVLVGLWHGLREVLHIAVGGCGAVGDRRAPAGVQDEHTRPDHLRQTRQQGRRPRVIAAVSGATALGALLAAITTRCRYSISADAPPW